METGNVLVKKLDDVLSEAAAEVRAHLAEIDKHQRSADEIVKRFSDAGIDISNLVESTTKKKTRKSRKTLRAGRAGRGELRQAIIDAITKNGTLSTKDAVSLFESGGYSTPAYAVLKQMRDKDEIVRNDDGEYELAS